MSDEELQSIIKNYGNELNDIKYLDFINDANPFKGQNVSFDPHATKSTYTPNYSSSNGPSGIDELMFRIKAQIKKERIRLGEFFLDHDVLRKGCLPKSKFRGVLNA
jgi:hypothetical protein